MPAVSAPEFRRSALNNQDASAIFPRAQRCAQARVAAAQNQDIDWRSYRFDWHIYRFRGGLRKFRIRFITNRSSSVRAMR